MKRKKPAMVANEKPEAGADKKPAIGTRNVKATARADKKPLGATDGTSKAETPAYELTAREKPIVEKCREAHTTAGMRMKLVKDADAPRLMPNHDHEFVGKLVLADALGAADLDFSDGLIAQLTSAGTRNNTVDPKAVNFMLSVVKSIQPKDQLEATRGPDGGDSHGNDADDAAACWRR